MISIVVCSVNEHYFLSLQQNIADTIGVPYEMIRIDNRKNTYSICSAYNEGAAKAKFELVCFAHEDIIFRTHNWGNKVISIFNEHTRLGLLGVAGTTYKSAVPSGWAEAEERKYINLIQRYKYAQQSELHVYNNPQNKSYIKTVCVDGVWMCTRKKIIATLPFDQKTFTGFHCYDLDFSLSVNQQYDVAVSFEILIEHFSEGYHDKQWVADTLKLHEKWQNALPVSIDRIHAQIQRNEETATLTGFFYTMLESGYSARQMLTMLAARKQNRFVSKKSIFILNFTVLKKIVKSYLKSHIPDTHTI